MNFIISIINPEMSERMNAICEALELPLAIQIKGHGTAQKNVLELLGLNTREYNITVTFADKEKTARLTDEARRQLYIDAPGHGIIVATPIKSVGGMNTLSHLTSGKGSSGAPEINYNYEIILAIANEGYTDSVMDAAREAGARGGTVLHGKGTASTKEAEKFFKVSIASEKEVIMIVARSSEKASIMRSIVNKAGVGTEAGAVVMSLPVSAVAGFGMLDNQQ